MKFPSVLLTFSAVALAIAGCIRSHRPETVYYTPAPAMVVPAPTSDRPETYVYPESPGKTVTPPSAPPPNVTPGDVTVATAVSQLLKGDPTLASASRNVRAAVDHGVVTLRGSVPTEHQRYEIVNRISRLPGVTRVADALDVSNR